MLANSLRTRGVNFAYLFGPPRPVGREEASKVHGAVCDRLGLDDLAFKYKPVGESNGRGSSGSSIVIDHHEGRRSLSVSIDNPDGMESPLRLLICFEWPTSPPTVYEQSDFIAEAVFDSMEGNWQKVLAEVRIRAQCSINRGNALTYIREHLLQQSGTWIDRLGSKMAFAGLKFEVPAQEPTMDALANPRREVTIEILREDNRYIYFDVMSQWPQFAEPIGTDGGIDLGSIRQISKKPNEYIKSAEHYLNELAGGFPLEKEKDG